MKVARFEQEFDKMNFCPSCFRNNSFSTAGILYAAAGPDMESAAGEGNVHAVLRWAALLTQAERLCQNGKIFEDACKLRRILVCYFGGVDRLKLHIDTAPVWEAYKADCECPLCAIREKVEAQQVTYFLGGSVMEPDQRIEVNAKGFCPRHFRQMYAAGNHLGLGLMLHTYLKNTNEALRKNAERLCAAAGTEAGKPIFARLGKNKGAELTNVVGEVAQIAQSCVMCERVRDNMERYLYTILHMYKHEPEFQKQFAASKGFCLNHYRALLDMAAQHLTGQDLARFVQEVTRLEMENLSRVEKEIEWYTLKFDYKNDDKPWGNSRDAVKRTINKVRDQVIDG